MLPSSPPPPPPLLLLSPPSSLLLTVVVVVVADDVIGDVFAFGDVLCNTPDPLRLTAAVAAVVVGEDADIGAAPD